ncbi:MAG TPA: threonine synthase [Oligoflexia bacterium]|nr:threonine synthase [Oligoflexia bacterium]
MKFISTNRKSPAATAKTAVMTGLAPDGGLYLPAQMPALPGSLSEGLEHAAFSEVCFETSSLFLKEECPAAELRSIAEDLSRFEPVLKPLSGNSFVLELFHGPTLAFKDYGARFMAHLMSFFNRGENTELTILVATSGDTGSAVASGFHLVPGIRVVILYPSQKVSPLQEKQLTTLGGNISALEILGTFDDCQRLAKEAFLDIELASRLRLTSANSINIARLIPQSFYFIYAAALLKRLHGRRHEPVVFSVPSGNFGNLTGGIIAKRLGLAASKFIAATNANDVVVNYLKTGQFKPRASVRTLSNAMDVGNPSNFVRLLELYHHDHRQMNADIFGAAFDDEQTKQCIRDVFKSCHYPLDPHGAVGCLGLSAFLGTAASGCAGIVCETAHPGKFIEVMQETIPGAVALPPILAEVLSKEKSSVVLDPQFEELKAFLLS